jgi:hypothetical protein
MSDLSKPRLADADRRQTAGVSSTAVAAIRSGAQVVQGVYGGLLR